MAYRSDELGVAQMFDELVAKGRARFDAALELQQALNDGAIILWYAGDPVVSDLPAIGNWLRDFVNDPKSAWLHYGYLVPTLEHARAQRAQFESICGLSKNEEESLTVPNRRFVSDEKLVAEALEGIRSGRWPNANQAALKLEKQAEGASPEAKVRRLGQKIRLAMS